jgi:hypothetical protein
MQKLIHSCQTAFIKGGYITNGVMLLQQIMRESKFRNQQGVILKIKFEKAYDNVNWDFLFRCWEQKGFSRCFMQWTRKAVTHRTLSMKVNACVGPYFNSYKGVR